MNTLLILTLTLTSCAINPSKSISIVDYSEKIWYFQGEKYPVVLGRALGGKRGSYKTPEGVLTVYAKMPHYRNRRGTQFNETLKFEGISKDGHQQRPRGIWAHRSMGTKTSLGCICPTREVMRDVIYPNTKIGDQVIVRK